MLFKKCFWANANWVCSHPYTPNGFYSSHKKTHIFGARRLFDDLALSHRLFWFASSGEFKGLRSSVLNLIWKFHINILLFFIKIKKICYQTFFKYLSIEFNRIIKWKKRKTTWIRYSILSTEWEVSNSCIQSVWLIELVKESCIFSSMHAHKKIFK